MKQYTKEWAKEYLREHPDVYGIAQDMNGLVCEFYGDFKVHDRLSSDWFPINEKDDWFMVDDMLEHPKGWRNSKVTRDMI